MRRSEGPAPIQPLSEYEKTYGECLERRRPQLAAILSRITHSWQLAEDAADLAIWEGYLLITRRQVHTLGPTTEHRWKWLKGVGHYKAIDVKYRDEWSRCVPIIEDKLVVLPRYPREDDEPDAVDHLQAVINNLSAFDRALVVYLYFEEGGHSQAEAARQFGVTEGAIAGLWCRLKKRLREAMSVKLRNCATLRRYT